MTDPTTPADHARAAAEAVRDLNTATGHGTPDGWDGPADAYQVVGALDETAGRLPQALEQTRELISCLDGIASDDPHAPGDAHDALGDAQEAATQLHAALARAHAAIGKLYLP